MSRLGHVVRPHMRMLKNGKAVPVGFSRGVSDFVKTVSGLRKAADLLGRPANFGRPPSETTDPATHAKKEILAKRARTARWGF
jgi:hypothetical protein